MRVGDDMLAAELEAALYELEPTGRTDHRVDTARVILMRVIRVLRGRLEALA